MLLICSGCYIKVEVRESNLKKLKPIKGNTFGKVGNRFSFNRMFGYQIDPIFLSPNISFSFFFNKIYKLNIFEVNILDKLCRKFKSLPGLILSRGTVMSPSGLTSMSLLTTVGCDSTFSSTVGLFS